MECAVFSKATSVAAKGDRLYHAHRAFTKNSLLPESKIQTNQAEADWGVDAPNLLEVHNFHTTFIEICSFAER
jgi:hypothetical protein